MTTEPDFTSPRVEGEFTFSPLEVEFGDVIARDQAGERYVIGESYWLSLPLATPQGGE